MLINEFTTPGVPLRLGAMTVVSFWQVVLGLFVMKKASLCTGTECELSVSFATGDETAISGLSLAVFPITLFPSTTSEAMERAVASVFNRLSI